MTTYILSSLIKESSYHHVFIINIKFMYVYVYEVCVCVFNGSKPRLNFRTKFYKGETRYGEYFICLLSLVFDEQLKPL